MALKTSKGVNQHLIDAFVNAFARSWETVWDQLKEARAIVAARHRDASAYDAARTAAGDIYLPATGTALDQMDRTVKITWCSASTKPAHDAIAALKAAMPEVVIVEQAPIQVDLRSSSKKLVDAAAVVGTLGVVLLVVYGLYRAFKG
ncbi:MAG: hypothetical protein ABI704_10075 [Kofleriaceae bacterium]